MRVPLYKQIQKAMLIEVESLKIHDAISSERDLAEKYDASRMTVRKALDTLVEEGYLYRDAKRGTFVADRRNLRKNTLISYMESSQPRLLYFNVRPTRNPKVQKELNVTERDHIVKMTRLFTSDEGPAILEELYIQRNKLKEEDIGQMTRWHSFNKFLKNDNVLTQRFFAEVVPVEYAKLLNLSLGSPVIIVENTISDKTGERLLYTRVFHNQQGKTIEITT